MACGDLQLISERQSIRSDFARGSYRKTTHHPSPDPNTNHRHQTTPLSIPGVELKEKEQGKFGRGVDEGKWELLVYFLVTQNFSFFKAGTWARP